MRSLHTRLDYRRDEVLKFAARFGQFRAMEEFEVKSYAQFSAWLREVTGDENFGLHPKISLGDHKTLGEQLTDAFLRKVAQLQDENQRLKAQIEMLKLTARANKKHDENLAIETLEIVSA